MSRHTLTKTEISLHWIVALGVLCMLGMGLYMVNTRTFSLMPTHKSIGTLLLLVILWRAGLRLSRGWPTNIATGRAWEHRLATWVHWLLLIGTLLMPISGLITSLAGGRGLSIFGLPLVAANLGPNGKAVALNAGLSDFAGNLHGLAAYLLIAAIALHVAGALKHHLIDRDDTLRRMLGRRVT